jgi:site-specific recombinase XerD
MKKTMVNFEPCIRKYKSNGYAQVYIRAIKVKEVIYISTSYAVTSSQVVKSKIVDYSIIAEVAPIIKSYYDKLNNVNHDDWSLREVIEFLNRDSEDVSFNDFFKKFTDKMKREGRVNPASNYTSALNSLKSYAGKDKFNFSDITSKLINGWIESMKTTARAKNLYPICISTVFSAGLLEYNDYDRDIIRIKNQPFMRVKIPKNELAKKKAIDKQILLKLFLADVSKAQMDVKTPLAKDVARLIFCLAGINVADLYYMEKSCRVRDKLIYNRHKTKSKRNDDALMEITIPKSIMPLFEKYKGANKLFSFSEQINSEKNFLKAIDMGLKEVATLAKVSENITTYTFRHSWATIAQNKCGASTEMVGFALNHASAHKVTEGYIQKDFSPIDDLNNKVIEYVFDKTGLVEKSKKSKRV